MITTQIKLKTLTKYVGVALLSAIAAFQSCTDETQSRSTPSVKSVSDSATITPITQLSYSLPSAIQVASIYKKAGMAYREGVTSQEKDASVYCNNVSKAINMGVYSADMSYALLNGQKNAVVEYMKLSRQMADNLGIGEAFSTLDLIKRFEKNISNGDSLLTLVSDLQFELDLYLDENNKQEITPIAFSGAWIETLYIGSKVNENRKNEMLNATLTDQMSILSSIISALKSVENKDKKIPELITDMESIQTKFDSFTSVQEYKKESAAAKKVMLKDNEIQELTKLVETLRFKFIKG